MDMGDIVHVCVTERNMVNVSVARFDEASNTFQSTTWPSCVEFGEQCPPPDCAVLIVMLIIPTFKALATAVWKFCVCSPAWIQKVACKPVANLFSTIIFCTQDQFVWAVSNDKGSWSM
jgi:hypothetical protein